MIKRILCSVGSMDTGGAETFLMKLYRSLDREKYQMDFCVVKKEKGFYDDEIISYGGKIFHVTPKSANPVKSFWDIRNVVKKNNYDYVMRVGMNSLSTMDLIAAKLGGAKRLVLRSSNSDTCGGKLSSLIHKLFLFLPKIVPNVKIAPSTEAAEFVFGKKSVEKGEVLYLNNAIPTEKYIFNQNIRKAKREELNLKDEFVVGHVGRFMNQKNHKFLIEIFSEVVKRIPEAVLLLIGEGELKTQVENQAKMLGISKNIRFLGVRKDVPEIMMAMDALLFPSFFEGMPNVLIEAQATGLHCITSDTVTKEANITGLVDYLNLKENARIWAEKLMEYSNGYERKDYSDIYAQKGYDIKSSAQKFVGAVFENE